MYTSRKRKFAFIVFVMFIMTFFCSTLFIAKESTHHCSNKADCPICAAIEAAEGTIKALEGGIVLNGFNALFLVVYILFILSNNNPVVIYINPVTAKVRMNN